MTLLSGRTTSGKLTVAYKVLASAQRSPHGAVAYTVALFDLTRTADPDYLARCGVDLDALLVARPVASSPTRWTCWAIWCGSINCAPWWWTA
jgi:RecA/RadA recombinase